MARRWSCSPTARTLAKPRHWRAPTDDTRLMSYLSRPIAGVKDDDGANGGTVVRTDGEPPMTTEIAQSMATPGFPTPM